MTLRASRLRDTLVNQEVTTDLIDQEGRDIVLHRDNSRQPDGAGGFYRSAMFSDVPQTTQRLFFTLSLYEPLYGTSTPSGVGEHEKFILIGPPDANIKIGDWFFVGIHKYVIGMMHDDRTYQTKCEGEAVTHGDDPA